MKLYTQLNFAFDGGRHFLSYDSRRETACCMSIPPTM